MQTQLPGQPYLLLLRLLLMCRLCLACLLFPCCTCSSVQRDRRITGGA